MPLLLSYEVITSPTPLQAGQTGSVTLRVTPIAAPVYCDCIALTVKVGSDPDCLFSSPPAAQVSSDLWNHDPLQMVRAARVVTEGGLATFTFSTADPDAYDIDYPLSLSLQATMGTTAGTFPILISETAGTSSDPSTFSTNEGSVTTSTQDANFYLTNFVATAKAQATVPCTEFRSGDQIYLSWESNGASYSLYRKSETTPFWTGTATSAQVSASATDTTFILMASSSTTTLTAAGVQATSTLADALTVTIVNPDLTPNTVTAKGRISGVGICPAGTVIMYSGNIADPAKFDPQGKGVVGSQCEGWQLCNGNNGAPDLRDKFIAGAGRQYGVGQAGGADQIALSVGQIPPHNHSGATGSAAPFLNYSGVQYCTQGVSTGIMVNVQHADPNGYRPNMLTTRGLPEIQVQQHNHGIALEGGGGAHENRPQFVALGYLYKL